jgi:hypothetical protein
MYRSLFNAQTYRKHNIDAFHYGLFLIEQRWSFYRLSKYYHSAKIHTITKDTEPHSKVNPIAVALNAFLIATGICVVTTGVTVAFVSRVWNITSVRMIHDHS